MQIPGTDSPTRNGESRSDGRCLRVVSAASRLLLSPLRGLGRWFRAALAVIVIVGTHDTPGTVKEFAGTISGEVEGTPYTGDFQEMPHDDHQQ